MKHQEPSHTAGGNVNQYNSIVWHYLLKLNICKPYNPALTPENKQEEKKEESKKDVYI